MATLKDHQKAMVDLLANGSAIPASAARLAHALHDVLSLLLERDSGPHSAFAWGSIEDVRLAADLDACSHSWAALSNAHTLECINCGVKKSDVAMGPRHRDAQNIDNLRAELADVTNQRNTYKARCESLEAGIVGLTCDYDALAEENPKLKAGIGEYQEDTRKAMD